MGLDHRAYVCHGEPCQYGSNNFEPLPIKFSDDKSPWSWTNEDDQRAEVAFALALIQDRVEPWVMTIERTPVMENPVDTGASSWAPTQIQTAFSVHAAEGQAGPSSWTLNSLSDMTGPASTETGGLNWVRAQIIVAFAAGLARIQGGPTSQALDIVPPMAPPDFAGDGAHSIRPSYDRTAGGATVHASTRSFVGKSRIVIG